MSTGENEIDRAAVLYDPAVVSQQLVDLLARELLWELHESAKNSRKWDESQK